MQMSVLRKYMKDQDCPCLLEWPEKNAFCFTGKPYLTFVSDRVIVFVPLDDPKKSPR